MSLAYEHWQSTRLERVPGRCGGHPTFVGSRLQQPHDLVEFGPEVTRRAVTEQDGEHARRFCHEEAHWWLLYAGLIQTVASFLMPSTRRWKRGTLGSRSIVGHRSRS
jgi:hypothetical protein